MLSYWQEAGRCGRDGRNAFSFIWYDNFTLSLKTTSKCIADIIINIDSTCIRRQIVDLLTVGTKEDTTDTKKCEGCDEQHCQCPPCKCCAVCIKNVLVMKGASIVRIRVEIFFKYRECNDIAGHNACPATITN